MHSVGAFEAKTHLSELLQRAERGEEITITRHGKPIAKLVPVTDDRVAAAARHAQAVDGFRALRKQYTLGGLKARDLINEGRK
jgi:prevent-host-death family protein